MELVQAIVFEQLFCLEELQQLQDQFAAATGVASIITRPDGTPITRPSKFCRLCVDIIRNTPIGLANCCRSDAQIGRLRLDGPTVQLCESGGLWDAGAGISVNGQHLANWLIGQVRDENHTEAQIREYAIKIGADEAQVVEAFFEIPSMSLERFRDIASLLFTLSSQLADTAAKKLLQNQLVSAKEVAEENETRFKALHNASFGGISIHDKGIILDCNQGLAEISGYSVEELVGMNGLLLIAERSRELVMKNILSGYEKSYEAFGVRKNGEEFPMRLEAREIPYKGKQVRTVEFRDITEQKQAEQMIENKNKELEQIVYVASHDLRSPLVNVDGYSREMQYLVEELRLALGEEHADSPNLNAARAVLPEMTDALRHVRNSTSQMDALLKGLLRLSRLGRAALFLEPLNMKELLGRVASSYEFQLRSAGISIEIGGLPDCQGDAVQVAQIFSNLIGNAVKFTDPSRPGVIRVSGMTEMGRSIYCVEDNGIGIAPEHQNNIFELFHRLNPADTEGEGLGLTIVRQVVGRLGGDIRLESQLGVGSRFFVALPAARSK